ncbi:DsbA family oxidoreductase [Hydrogenophaga sp.]|uniref:DsbA family oxidoreductase n=1 Tax=Hydrogenophaga sp. TaxID=1904254 RepID=UPI003F6BDC04
MSTASDGPPAAVQIDVWFDLVCPWCLIGKRHLDQAVAQWRETRPQDAVVMRWHSVRLIEGVPPEGWDYNTFYEQRLGGPGAVRSRQAEVQAAAQQADVTIDFARIRVFPDSGPAHQLLALAGRQLGETGRLALLERLFEAHFQRGERIAERPWLLLQAQTLGLDHTDVVACWALPLPAAPSVPGVPFFVFNQRVALSGAQAPAVLLQAMQAALSDAVSDELSPALP